MRSAAPQKLRSGNASRNPIMKFVTSSRPRRGACSEYCKRMLGAPSSSTILRFQGLPQNSLNQRPTIALLSCSFDMVTSFDLCGCDETAYGPSFARGVSDGKGWPLLLPMNAPSDLC